MYKILPVHLTEQPFKNKAPRIKMLRLKAQTTLPFLCFCFWIIIFSIFLTFFLHLAPYAHTPHPNEGEDCGTLPLQNQYELIKKDYIWKGTGNITDAILCQSCPDPQNRANIYYADSYVGGVLETEVDTIILNCKKEPIYTVSSKTLYDSEGGIVGTMEWEEDGLLVLTNPSNELVAQWVFEPNRLFFCVHSEVDRVLLFAVASKFAFGDFNDCTTKYWMSLQIVIISGILSIASIVVMSITLYKMKNQLAHRYSRKNFRLQTLNKSEW